MMTWRALTTAQQANSSGGPAYAYGVNRAKYWVESCCHENHAWWVVAGAMFLSTWGTEDEARSEASRLNEVGATLSDATR